MHGTGGVVLNVHLVGMSWGSSEIGVLPTHLLREKRARI